MIGMSIMLMWLLPLWIVMCGSFGLWMGMKRAREEPANRRRRLEQYRASSESHILNLRG
jgi:cytochrome c-type biogenesis protein CcmH/NrfF